MRMKELTDTALVLEGGGMRGVFTCGVLDSFIDKGIHFPYVIGVSAGACNGLSFISRQRGRARYSNIDMLKKYHYIGYKYILSQRCIMDFDLLFRKFPDKILPYDYDAYFNAREEYEMVATSCLTGKAVYLSEHKDKRRLVQIARASSSLPFVCPITRVDGTPMLDGGIVDSIPYQRAFERGYSKVVAILTRHKGYRKQLYHTKVPPFIYHRYPELRQAINRRSEVYNRQLAEAERLEEEGKMEIIRPVCPVKVDRIEKDVHKLQALYEEGYACGVAFCDKMCNV